MKKIGFDKLFFNDMIFFLRYKTLLEIVCYYYI
jgi:hypothetical protein